MVHSICSIQKQTGNRYTTHKIYMTSCSSELAEIDEGGHDEKTSRTGKGAFPSKDLLFYGSRIECLGKTAPGQRASGFSAAGVISYRKKRTRLFRPKKE